MLSSGFGKQSAPAAPDYTGAAQATAQGNLQAAQTAAAANRVNQVTPYGSLTYSESGKDSQGNPMWTATQALSPEQQKILDYQNQTSLGLGSIQNQGLDYVKNMLAQPFDTSKLPAEMINAGQTAQDAIMSRLEPTFGKRQAALETQLANQGIARGTEAWKNAQTDLDQARNDAYTQAALQGMGIGQQARQQSLQEQAFLRNEPINTLNAVRSGSQVQGPSFVNVPQQATTQGADLMGAANLGYQNQLANSNAQNASNSNMMSGLFTLGGAALGGAMGGIPGATLGAGLGGAAGKSFSDRRLKTNIKHIGHTPSGLNIYSYDYVWGEPSIGVMADEVKHIPGAVIRHSSGYDMVDYSKVK